MRGEELDYSGEQPVQEENGLVALDRLIRERDYLRAKMLEAEQAYKDAKAKYEEVAEKDLPDYLKALGVKQVRMTDGRIISLKTTVTASLPKKEAERLEAGIDWLEREGQDAIIKRNVTAVLGKGEDYLARRLAEVMREAGAQVVQQERSVHHSTLSALVRELMRAGRNFTEEERKILGIWERDSVVVKDG